MTGTAQTQEENAILLIEIHYLDVPSMGRDVGPQGVEGAFDALDGVHVCSLRNSYLLVRNITSVESQESASRPPAPFKARYSRAARSTVA
jgi:hypothetical protein